MKRALVALLLAAGLLVPAFGQFVPTSLQNGLTAGTMFTEIDQSFQANAGFGSYGDSFLFAGLGNPLHDITAHGSLPAPTTPPTAPNAQQPRFGYYMAGSFPLSLYGSASFTRLKNRTIASAYTTPTYLPGYVDVVTDTTTTRYKYITESASHTPTGTIYLNSYTADLQALARLGPAVVGLYLNLAANNNAADVAAANGYFDNVVTTYNYNSAAAGAAPVAAVDYSKTLSTTNVNSAALPDTFTPGNPYPRGMYSLSDTIRFAIPFAMKTGDLEHRANVDTSLEFIDQSAAYSASQTAHASSIGADANDHTISITSKTSNVDVSLNYNLYLPAGRADDVWVARAKFDIGINSKEYSFDELVRPYSYTTPTVKQALAIGGVHEVMSESYKSGLDLGGTLSGARVFTFKPAGALTFKLIPSLGFTLSKNEGAAYSTGGSYYQQGLNATGAYDATTYNLVTTSVTGTPGNTTTITGSVSLPMGAMVRPDGWKFGILMGAAPSLALSSATTTTASFTTTQTTRTYTGDTVSATTITTTTDAPAKQTSTFSPTFTENHYIGITIPFDGGVRFDARINGNLLSFESFTIQALIPLR